MVNMRLKRKPRISSRLGELLVLASRGRTSLYLKRWGGPTLKISLMKGKAGERKQQTSTETILTTDPLSPLKKEWYIEK